MEKDITLWGIMEEQNIQMIYGWKMWYDSDLRPSAKEILIFKSKMIPSLENKQKVLLNFNE